MYIGISSTFLYFSSINGLKMSELVELGRRLKRSLDGNISYRKAAILTIIVLGECVRKCRYFCLLLLEYKEHGAKKGVGISLKKSFTPLLEIYGGSTPLLTWIQVHTPPP